ncbi:CBS domain-containing protein [Salinithrix halophila]|uniref:CBS domain-containing protein n=1 Tax=Salinithrix halophila TaxID=1485204 RepID=A0ABV8JEW8_9BACL
MNGKSVGRGFSRNDREHLRLREFIDTRIEPCKPSDKTQSVLKKMNRKRLEYLPVCKKERLVGMVRDRDLLEALASGGKKAARSPVAQWMQKAPAVGKLDWQAREAIQVMEKHGISCLPVFEDGKWVGLVTLADLAAEKSLSWEAGRAYRRISRGSQPPGTSLSFGLAAAGMLLGTGVWLALKSRR